MLSFFRLVVLFVIFLTSGASTPTTNLQQESNCTADCIPTQSVERISTPKLNFGNGQCVLNDVYSNSRTKGCGCVTICDMMDCGMSSSLVDDYPGTLWLDNFMGDFFAGPDLDSQLTFRFSWEIKENKSGNTSTVNLPLVMTVRQYDDDNLGLETTLIVNTDPCALSVSDLIGKIGWKFDVTYQFYFRILSSSTAPKLWTKSVRTQSCEYYYTTPEKQQKYCGKKLFPAPDPPQNVMTCLVSRHGHAMDVSVKWLPSKSVAPIVLSTVTLNCLKTSNSYAVTTLASFDIHNNGTSYLLKSVNTTFHRYCVDVSSSIDSHLTAPDSSESELSFSCFSNSSIEACEKATPVVTFVVIPQSNDSHDLRLVWMIGGPVAAVALILILVILVSVCWNRRRPDDKRSLVQFDTI